VIVYLFDVNEISAQELQELKTELHKQQVKFLMVGNKSDMITTRPFSQNNLPVIFISAKTGEHIELLKQRLVDMVLEGQVQTEGTIVTNARHYHALTEVAASLDEIKKGLDTKLTVDLLSLDIRRCLHYLGEITGEITTEDQLDYIFSKFCIGK